MKNVKKLLEEEYGTVEFEGLEYVLERPEFSHNIENDDSYYLSVGYKKQDLLDVLESGKEKELVKYFVTWDILDVFKNDETGEMYTEFDELPEEKFLFDGDDSSVCDWDVPRDVQKVQ